MFDHAYSVLFIGLLIGGEAVLLPAIYLALEGKLDLLLVIGIALAATTLSDTFWYGLGRTLPLSAWSTNGRFSRFGRTLAAISALFSRRALMTLFLSKFVYGTRTAVQILSGAHRISFLPYFFVNLSGILLLNAVFVILGATAKNFFDVFADSPWRIWVSFGVFVALALAIHMLFKKLIWKKWSQ